MNYSVNVDLAELEAAHSNAERFLRRVPMIVHGRLAKEATLARNTHRYRNRTWHLQQSTFARGPVRSGGESMTEFGARTHYAGHVEALGYQDIRGHAERAAADITNLLLDGARAL